VKRSSSFSIFPMPFYLVSLSDSARVIAQDLPDVRRVSANQSRFSCFLKQKLLPSEMLYPIDTQQWQPRPKCVVLYGATQGFCRQGIPFAAVE
jgi:hypothetical protein